MLYDPNPDTRDTVLRELTTLAGTVDLARLYRGSPFSLASSHVPLAWYPPTARRIRAEDLHHVNWSMHCPPLPPCTSVQSESDEECDCLACTCISTPRNLARVVLGLVHTREYYAHPDTDEFDTARCRAAHFLPFPAMLAEWTSMHPRGSTVWKSRVLDCFDRLILFVIMLNCLVLATDKEVDFITDNVEVIDLVFLIIYTLEMVLKIIAMGFVMREHSYLMDSWNKLDFFVVLMGWIS